MKGGCIYDIYWRGRCGQPTEGGTAFCNEHSEERCSVCGGKAVRSCGWASSLTCGAPICSSPECWDKHQAIHQRTEDEYRKRNNPTVKDIKERGLEIIRAEKKKAILMAEDLGVSNRIVKDQCSKALSRATFMNELRLISEKEMLELSSEITGEVFDTPIKQMNLMAGRGRSKDGR